MTIRSGIYKIQSISKPDKFYIGSAKYLQNRKAMHFTDLEKQRHHTSKLQNHYNKYGKDDLEFIVIEPCFPMFLLIREQYYIDTLKPFFNSSPTACSNLGSKWSEESKKNLSAIKKGIPSKTKGRKFGKRPPEFCKNQAERMKGNKRNEGKRWKWTEEQKDKLRGENNHFFGKQHPVEIIEKMMNTKMIRGQIKMTGT